MTTVIRRRGAAAVLTVVLGLVLGSCASGPSQVNAAAIVDGRTIGVGQVQELVDRAVKAEPAAQTLADQHKLGDLSREVLTQLVMHELITSYTAQNPVTVDPAQLSQVAEQIRASTEPLPTDGTAAPEAIVATAATKVFEPEFLARDYLALAAIGDRELNSVKVTFDYAVLAPGQDGATGSLREKALAKARQLAVGLDRAAAVQKQDTADGELQWETITTTPTAQEGLESSALFGTGPNTVVAFQPNQQNASWIIALIREREVSAPQAGAAKNPLQVAIPFGQRVLQSWVDRVGVKISPRYGVFDQVAMRLAAGDAESTGVLVPVKVDAKP
ncbi:PpiC-type peptidyl-prolyl cis-trans isomerase precursor [Actinokineospora spheciospongiae]|uniref:PpiC-type peptidyl-prolyl cis-trans isomerase n=1 Tax=Actinokineospora spheciospongiae TaxID=909613 RepID=W7J1F5_9PSEU|nr:hypothetical protein [Actinokineospora spheciospongiae]EWC62751.1 PpiC-type peptidyl-prolyl cis-trans isomerase precursor [Actinokineospora spheciospongiae]